VIKNPNDIVEELIADYLKIFGADLISAVMYGSAVSHEYRPGKSDINVFFVVKDNAIAKLAPSVSIQKKWHRRGVSFPLFMTKEYIACSIDTFPVEFFDMQTSHRVLYGEDPIGNLKIEFRFLRLQCERELKGIALKLRSEYARAAGNTRRLDALVDAAVRRLIPVFKALLALNDRKIPSGKSEIIAVVENFYGLTTSACSDVYHARRNKLKAEHTRLFDSFIKQIDTMITIVDKQDTGRTV
jgi:hypothetical protein